MKIEVTNLITERKQNALEMTRYDFSTFDNIQGIIIDRILDSIVWLIYFQVALMVVDIVV